MTIKSTLEESVQKSDTKDDLIMVIEDDHFDIAKQILGQIGWLDFADDESASLAMEAWRKGDNELLANFHEHYS